MILPLIIVMVFVTLMSLKVEKESPISTLSRQSARYAYAAEQDQAPLVSLLHANYATGYLWALKDIAREEEINSTLGPNMSKKLELHVTKVQDQATRKATKVCPGLVTPYSNIDILRLAGNV